MEGLIFGILQYLLSMLWQLLNYTPFCDTHIGPGLVESSLTVIP